MNEASLDSREVTLLDVLDRLLSQGVVLVGDLTLSVANVDLLYVELRLLLTSVERMTQWRQGTGLEERSEGYE